MMTPRGGAGCGPATAAVAVAFGAPEVAAPGASASTACNSRCRSFAAHPPPRANCVSRTGESDAESGAAAIGDKEALRLRDVNGPGAWRTGRGRLPTNAAAPVRTSWRRARHCVWTRRREVRISSNRARPAGAVSARHVTKTMTGPATLGSTVARANRSMAPGSL